jgi:hypothetical protein
MDRPEFMGGWTARAALLAVFSGHAAMSLVYDALPPVLVRLANHGIHPDTITTDKLAS